MADFDFYINEYKGNVISNVFEFEHVVIEAQAYVDNLVVNPNSLELMELTDINQKYNLAICSVADVIYKQSKLDRTKSSESVGNHSVSYASVSDRDMQQERFSRAVCFLRGTGLMYGGMH